MSFPFYVSCFWSVLILALERDTGVQSQKSGTVLKRCQQPYLSGTVSHMGDGGKCRMFQRREGSKRREGSNLLFAIKDGVSGKRAGGGRVDPLASRRPVTLGPHDGRSHVGARGGKPKKGRNCCNAVVVRPRPGGSRS